MKKILSLCLLFFVAFAAHAQTTTFTANLKDLGTNVPGAYVELSLKNCAGTGTVATIPHVNGVGAVTFPVNLYPVAGAISATVYDQTAIVCGSATGVAYYHIAIYQGDAVRSLVKKLLFADDFNVQGTSFNLNSATPRSASVITPPPATSVLTNPAGDQTIVQPGGSTLIVNGAFSVTGLMSFLGGITVSQPSNGSDAVFGKRFTDTSPTGNLLHFKNAANTTDLWTVDVTGSLATGIIPAARVSGVLAAGNLPNPSASTLGGIESLASVASKWISAISTAGVPSATQPAFTDISGSVACGQVPALTGDVTRTAGSCATTLALTVPIAKGGTGQTTAAAAFNALSPMTTLGDVEYESGASTASRLAGNTTTTKKYLSQTGNGTVSAAPAWAQIAAADLSDGNTGSGSIVHATSPSMSDPTLTGTTQVKRIRATQGTTLVAGDFALSAGWGTTATVTGISGTDQRFTATFNSSGTGQAANPTVTLTYHDGTWTTAPVMVCQRGDGNSPTTSIFITQAASSATAAVQQFLGTPVSGSGYTIWCMVMG